MIKLSDSIPRDQPVSNDAQLIAAAILTLQMSTVNAVATVDELIDMLFGDGDGHDQDD